MLKNFKLGDKVEAVIKAVVPKAIKKKDVVVLREKNG